LHYGWAEDEMLKRSIQAVTIAALMATLSAGRGDTADLVAEAKSRITLAPSSRLLLRGKSTMHDFSSTATRIDLAVEVADELPAGPTLLARLAGPGAVKSVVLTIPVEAMKALYMFLSRP
jgi:hypothetical protein